MGFQWVTGISFEVTLDFCIITKVLLNSSHKNKMSMVTYIVSIKKKIQNKQNNIINSYVFQMNIFYMPNKFIYQTERSLLCLECDNQREIRSVQTLR